MPSSSRLVPFLLLALAPACGGGGGASDPPDAAPAPDATPPPCAPTASCTAIDHDCLGLVDNAGDAVFGLRMSQLTLSKPTALTTGIVSSVITGAIQPSLAECNVSGSATFNWLLQLDTAAGTLETGGAKPVADPTTGYTFDDEVIGSAHVAPATAPVAIDAHGVFSHDPLDVILPVFLDAGGTQSVLLPLSRLTIGGTLSADHNCVGSYNAAGLDPASSCLGDPDHPTFLEDGAVAGHLTLEAADAIVITALNQSLCVLLSGDAATYGDGGNPVKCKRDAQNQIVFHGDWCDTTDAAATASCYDSVRFEGTFAASSVQID